MTKRAKRTGPWTQPWWRFSGYELRDGDIRPAPDAELEAYSPWDLYRECREAGQRDAQPPYQSLGVLLDDFHGDPHGPGVFARTDEADTAITRWCQQYGLLGVLLQETQMAFFPPRSVWAWNSEAIPDEPVEPAWELDHYTREAGVWHAYRVFSSGSGGEWEDPDDLDPTQLERRSPCDEIPDCPVPATWPQPHALTRDVRRPMWARQPLSESWFRYFPGVTDHMQPTPMPPSPEFWATYAEPLDDFLRAAALLRSAMDWFVNTPKKRRVSWWAPGPDIPTRTQFPGLVWAGMPLDDLFRRLLIGVSPTIVTTGKGTRRQHRQAWTAPSLLGMFAAMMLTDLDEGRDFRTCVAGPHVFVSSAHAAEYCSPECRWKINKQRQRKRKKDAIRLHGRGWSPSAIREKVGAKNVQTVKGWIRDHAPTKRRRRG